eukprot:2911097-Prymnesium_polylepis.1
MRTGALTMRTGAPTMRTGAPTAWGWGARATHRHRAGGVRARAPRRAQCRRQRLGCGRLAVQ